MKVFVKDLGEGLHELHEEVPAGVLPLPDPESYPNPVIIDLVIDRLENIYRIKISIRTKAKLICDRCLDDYDYEFQEMTEQIYQVGSGTLDDDEEVEILPVDAREIDVSGAISDVFLMSRSIRLLCSEDCKGLCPHCGTNLNHKKCKCDRDIIDPRLEKLKSLLK